MTVVRRLARRLAVRRGHRLGHGQQADGDGGAVEQRDEDTGGRRSCAAVTCSLYRGTDHVIGGGQFASTHIT
jgi:hypothetical protein